MKLTNILAALVLGCGAAAGHAGAEVLTFDSLTKFGFYGNGEALLGNMSANGQSLSYQESGFLVTLTTPNAPDGAAHIGDGTYVPQTFNWHDGLENALDSFVTLTRIGGGKFNLVSFDYYTDHSVLSADGSQVGVLQDWGTWTTGLNGISELRLSSGAFNELDNINVASASAVPEPETLPLLLGGLAMVGAMLRRRRG
ncbi:PEP-CTERM sorting domain-containing protein [Oxalobacteraceae bacterium OTU3CAMAD1]|nr:PEP-CTERM sorting domain-containing protein [Oxalobacteraceae bacterium OTU3CAMAD1]